MGFNPRTRVGCDDSAMPSLTPRPVSIHAPVWGATDTVNKITDWAKFQSTHPCGVRRQAGAGKSRLLVSIHAPVWGATHQCGQGLTL